MNTFYLMDNKRLSEFYKQYDSFPLAYPVI
jgi:hypothetical protein